MASLGLIAIFLERLLLVIPSLSPTASLPLGLGPLLITAGFFPLFVLGRRRFLARLQTRL